MSTDQDKIDAVESAIEKAQVAAEYETPDRTRVKRPGLGELQDRLDTVKSEAAISQRGGMYVPIGGLGERV